MLLLFAAYYAAFVLLLRYLRCGLFLAHAISRSEISAVTPSVHAAAIKTKIKSPSFGHFVMLSFFGHVIAASDYH